MKKIIILFVLAAASSLNVTAQNKNTSTESSSPEITFEKDLHDYGTLEYGADGVYAFKFTNTGNEPLIISDAKGSCGCTVPKFPKEPILKGQSGLINVSYDTKRPGPFTKTVTVTSNAKSASKVLTIKGSVLSQEQTDDQTPVMKGNGLSPLENTSK